MSGLARTPTPPYYAVIFTSIRTPAEPEQYDAAAARMLELAQQRDGFLGIDSVRAADGNGITVSYWRDEAAIAAWRRDAEHAAVRERGRRAWYGHFEVRVAKVERAYQGPPEPEQA